MIAILAPIGKAVYLKLSLALGGLILGVGCGSSEQGGATDKAGPTPEDILKEQKAIAEYYMISYKGKFVADKKTGKIEQLLLSSAPLTDLGVDRIAKLTDLTALSLVSTKITDEGLKYLSKLPKLRKLELGKNNITDAGVEHLVKIKSLASLSLANTRVADAGLIKLSEMPGLIYLDVRRSRVTPRGVGKFEKTPLGRKRGFRFQN